MKKLILFLLLLTFVYLNVKIDDCQINKVILSEEFKDHSNLLSNLPELFPFSLELKSANSEANCYIESPKSSTRYAYCYVLSEFLDDLNRYKNSNYNKVIFNNHKFGIKISNSFKFETLNKCEYSKKKTPILFRQVNNFNLNANKGTFMFYGVTKGKFNSDLSITFFVNIIYEKNIETKKAKSSSCSSNNMSSYLYQIACTCTIEDIEDHYYKYIRILDSDDISGIPYGYNVRLSPIETQIAIQNEILIDYTKSNPIILFDINKIECQENQGILRFNGKMKSGEIKESKNLKFLISSKHECQSECIIPATKLGDNVNIDCILCSNITRKNNFNFDQIITYEKYEIMFNDSSNAGEMECKAMNFKINLTYEAINSFKIENNKIKFNLIGNTIQSISQNNHFALYLYLISNGKKEPNLSVATLSYNNTENK